MPNKYFRVEVGDCDYIETDLGEILAELRSAYAQRDEARMWARKMKKERDLWFEQTRIELKKNVLLETGGGRRGRNVVR